MAQRPLYKLWGYNALRVLCRLAGVGFFGTRVYGRSRVPRGRPNLICANHQSLFDPLIVGLALDEPVNAVARRTLFDIPVLNHIIDYLGAIPVERGGAGAIGGIKETLKRLKRGEQMLIFPEGTRTRDGEVAPLKPGFATLARRTDAPIVPMGFDGAYQAWPRTKRFPGFSRVIVVIGEPILPGEYATLSDDELLAEVERRMLAAHAEAKRQRQRRGLIVRAPEMP